MTVEEVVKLALSHIEGERADDLAESLEAHGATEEALRERFLCPMGQHEAMDRAFIAHWKNGKTETYTNLAEIHDTHQFSNFPGPRNVLKRGKRHKCQQQCS